MINQPDAPSRRTCLGALALSVLAVACSDGPPAPVQDVPGKVLKIGLNANYPPYEWVNDQHRLVGFDVELANAIGEQLGRPVKFVNNPWTRLLASLEEGTVDALISALAITPERLRDWVFTVPYHREAQSLLLPATTQPDLLALQRIGVLADSSAILHLQQLNVPAERIIPYDGVPPLFDSLRQHRVNALFGDASVLAFLQKTMPQTRLVHRAGWGADDQGLMLSLKRPRLLQQMNQALAVLESNGRLPALRQRWLDQSAVKAA